jgi:hypothetical protein
MPAAFIALHGESDNISTLSQQINKSGKLACRARPAASKSRSVEPELDRKECWREGIGVHYPATVKRTAPGMT